MAIKTYTGYSGEKSNGSSEFGFAGAYISYIPSSSQWYATDTATNPWPELNYRRWFGADCGGGQWTYVYCAHALMPAGNDLSITLTLTGNNGYWYGSSGNEAKNILVGYSTTAPAAGTERCAGKSNSPSGLTVHDTPLVISAKSGTYQNTSGSITIPLPNSYSGKKVYFYFWGYNYNTHHSVFSFAGLSGSVTYTDYSSVSEPSIVSITPSVMPKGGTCDIKIVPSSDGSNNAVSEYKIYYGTSSSLTTSSKSITKNKPDADNIIKISHSEIGSPAAGSRIYFGIQAIGSVTGYDSSLSKDQDDYVDINSAPSKPTVKLAKTTVPNNGDDEMIEISQLVATDDDRDLTYQYCASSSSSSPSSGWIAVPNDYVIVCNKSKKYVHFRAYDGYQYGASTYVLLSVNDGPGSVSVAVADGEGYKGYDGDCYTRKLTVAASGSGSYTYSWEYRYGTDGTWQALGTGQSLNNINIAEGIGQIYVRFTATDGHGDSKQVDAFNTGLRYARGYASNNIVVDLYQLPNLASSNNTTAYSRNMSTKMKFDAMTVNDLTISRAVFSLEDASGKIYDMITLNGPLNAKDISKEIERNLSFSSGLTYLLGPCSLICRYYGENASGNQLLLYEKNNSISFLPLLNFIFSENLTPEQKSIDLDIVNLSSGEESVIVRYHANFQIEKYEILITLEGGYGQHYITDYVTFTPDGEDSAKLTFPSNKLYSMFQSLKLRSDQDYKGTALIRAINVLGESYHDAETEDGNLASFSIRTTAAPEFRAISGYNAPNIYQHISQTSSKMEGNHNPDWTQSTIEESSRMFNPGEYLYFDSNFSLYQPMDKWFDGSGNAPTARNSSYKYSILYTTVTGDTGPTQDSEWKEITGLSEISSLNGTFRIPETFQPITGPEKIFFCLRVRDEIGKYAVNPSRNGEEHIYVTDSKQYLLWCRCVSPVIRIANCSKENGRYNVRFEVEDFGGNNKGYTNFNRFSSDSGVTEGTEGAMKITWSCGTTLSDMVNAHDEPIHERISSLVPLGDGKSKVFDFGTLNGYTGRIYVKAKITFYTNSAGASLEGETQIYASYTEQPTIAYRSHVVGINTKPDDNRYADDVLVISDFENKRYVRLFGLDDEAQPRDILIDLKTGAVSGLVIDGGSW